MLNFIEKGSNNAPALVFLHYFGGSSNTWMAVITELSKTYHCIGIDLSGWGNSSASSQMLSVHDHAKDVLEVVKYLNLKNYSLVGHSMGGKIAFCIATQKPAGLKALILVAPSPPTPEPMQEQDRADLMNAFGDRLAIEELIMKITHKPLSKEVYEQTIQSHLQASQTAWNSWIEIGSKEDISFLMSNITLPATVISGSEDPNFSSDFLKTEFINYFPSALFTEIKGSGHLIPIETPIELADSIQKFLVKNVLM